jgi:hypothetical protein
MKHLSRPNEYKEKAAKNDLVAQRAKAFSLYLAKVAEEDPKVKQFRQDVLEGALISSEKKAQAFIFSHATAVLSLEGFKKYGVPLVGHIAQVREIHRLPSEGSNRVQGKVEIEWQDGELMVPFEGTPLSSDPYQRDLLWGEQLSALQGSVISYLLEVEDHLREKFPWEPLPWDILQTPMFVLVGRVPRVEPIRVTLPQRDAGLYETTNIKVLPWVSVENVASLYERARQELNPTPTTSPRRLALFIFMMQQPEVKVQSEGVAPRASWETLRRAWNRSLPAGHEWRYEDRANFRLSFLSAFKQIVNYYRLDT